jgi:anaerobic ribonucleoside-triphosphate reductase activating protein
MKYSGIIKHDIANGEGIRVSLFVSGCNQHCPDCFNQDSQNFYNGKTFTNKTFDEIIELVSRPEISGLSILGGEPLDQTRSDLFMLNNLCITIKHNLNKTIWLWTGHVLEDIIFKEQLDLLKNIDVLIDGPYIASQTDLSLKWRGSKNQRVIDMNQSRNKNHIVLYNCKNQ